MSQVSNSQRHEEWATSKGSEGETGLVFSLCCHLNQEKKKQAERTDRADEGSPYSSFLEQTRAWWHMQHKGSIVSFEHQSITPSKILRLAYRS